MLTKYGMHDPIGVPITYLLNGAPWIIGNLWDVTDKDIDRLSVVCMENIFKDEKNEENANNSNISRSLNQSRNVCKLKCAVGSAPVMYGIPIVIDSNSSTPNI